jgi:hypothetical protein
MIIQPPYHFVIGCRDGAYRTGISEQEVQRLYYEVYNGTKPGLSITRVRFENRVLGNISQFLGLSKPFSYEDLNPTSVVVVMEQWMQEHVLELTQRHSAPQQDLGDRIICLNVPLPTRIQDLIKIPPKVRQELGNHLSFSDSGLEINL